MSEAKLSSIHYVNAWNKLKSLLSLLLKSDCPTLYTDACVRMMDNLLHDGDSNKDRRVLDGLSILNEMAGKEVAVYVDAAGRVIGFGTLREVNPDVIAKQYERTKMASEIFAQEEIDIECKSNSC